MSIGDPTEVGTRDEAGLEQLLAYPLVDALTHRRSRRFSLGASMPGGGLAYTSRHEPVPLSRLEEAILCFAAVGLSGFCLADLPYKPGRLHEGGGGNVMATLTGRTGASADAVHGTGLFLINDEATYFIKRPQDFPLDEIDTLARMARHRRFEEVFDRMRVRVRDGRAAVAREVPVVFPFNKWSTNLPGTTYFLPVSDLSGMYINVILSMFDEQMGLFIVDERARFRPAGIARFGKSRGGPLHDDLDDGDRVFPIVGLEAVILEFLLAEQAFLVHNLSLMEQAMGLGGWTHFATATETSWLRALGFRLGSQRLSQALRASWFTRLLMRLLGRDREVSYGLGLTIDGADLLRPFCPPYYRTMEEAVLAFLDLKKARAWQAPLRPEFHGTWRDPRAVQVEIPPFSDACIAATIAYCTYIYETYGRFPAYYGPMRTTLAHQAHHLDLEFYDRFYGDGAYTATQAKHQECWHPPASSGPPGPMPEEHR